MRAVNILETQQHRCQLPMQVLMPFLVECGEDGFEETGRKSSKSSPSFRLDVGKASRCPGGKKSWGLSIATHSKSSTFQNYHFALLNLPLKQIHQILPQVLERNCQNAVGFSLQKGTWGDADRLMTFATVSKPVTSGKSIRSANIRDHTTNNHTVADRLTLQKVSPLSGMMYVDMAPDWP